MLRKIQSVDSKVDKFKNLGDDFFDQIVEKKKSQVMGVVGALKENDNVELALTEKNPFILYKKGKELMDLGLLAAAKDLFIDLLKIVEQKDNDLAVDLLNKINVCARLTNDKKCEKRYWEVYKLRISIAEANKNFMNSRNTEKKVRIKSMEEAEAIIGKLIPIMLNNEGSDQYSQFSYIYSLRKRYAQVLDEAGQDQEAIEEYKWLIKVMPNDYYNYLYLADFYLERSQNQDDNYQKAVAVLKDLKSLIEGEGDYDKQLVMVELKKTFWRLCRQNDRFARCKEIVLNQLAENDIGFIREHFRINLNFNIDDPIVNNYNFLSRFKKIVPEIEDVFLNNKMSFNEYIPEKFHLKSVTRIDFRNGVRKDNKFALAHLFVESGDLEDIDNDRNINVYIEGLTIYEIYQILLHEIGHNSYFLLSEQERETWNKLVEDYNLGRFYSHQSNPEMEAYADLYAIFILFNDLWRDLKRLDGVVWADENFPDKNLVLYNFFKNIFKLDALEKNDACFKQTKFKDDFEMFKQNITDDMKYMVAKLSERVA